MKPRHKIILYNPEAVFYTLPLALISVASKLDPNKFEILIIDARIEKNHVQKVLNEAKNALCLGITVLTGDPVRGALKISREVKKYYPNLPVIWGGWHPSLFPVQTLKEDSIDITVQGQGEYTFDELVNALADKKELSAVAGISYKKDNTAVQNAPRAMHDMNELPFQNYDLINVKNYYKLKKQRVFDYISSTGCYFRCTFCADPFVYKRKWTALEPERIGEEIQYNWNKYGFDELAFQDETFFTYKERVIEIAEEFLKRGLKFKWTATMRADQGMRLGEDTMKLLVKSGLRWVLIGVESGSNEMLKWLKKDITVEQILYCAEMCRKFGIHVNFPSIVGFPGETDESLNATLKLVTKLRRMSPKFETPIFYFKPYPGSAITIEMEKAGYKLPSELEEWADFDYVGSSGPWVDEQKYNQIEKFKFYNRFAGGRESIYKKPLQIISRWRLDRGIFSVPIEKLLVEKLFPSPKLS